MLSKVKMLANRSKFGPAGLKKPTFQCIASIPLKHLRVSAATQAHVDVFTPIRFYSDAPGKAEVLEETHEFQAETKRLLDIVAKSLYSDKEVFLRELISNACDALEKLRYLQNDSTKSVSSEELKIELTTHKQERTLIIEDNGIGMTKEDLLSNLGTIAKSGSKAFIEDLKNRGEPSKCNSVIGQFGVGFYSVFMVADKVVVLSKPTDGPAHQWICDGSDSFTLREARKQTWGTRITLHLKPESRMYSDEGITGELIKKYCSFVNFPVNLNGRTMNTMKPLWIREPKGVTLQEHNDFYRSISKNQDKIRFVLHFKTDAPINLNVLIYFPQGKPGLFNLNSVDNTGLQLYVRRVLIKQRASELLPRWLRFVKGVVDSEDLPLNLSRELLQDVPVIQKVKSVITSRIVKFLLEKAAKDPSAYSQFHEDYSIFIKEGVVTGETQEERQDAASSLLFETSKSPAGTFISLHEYCKRMGPNQKHIYYLAVPSREFAEASPYFEAMKTRDVEILFCYENYDEIVLMHLKEFNGREVISVEHELRKDATISTEGLALECLEQPVLEKLMVWIHSKLQNKVENVVINEKLDQHPCVVSVEDMAMARHFVKTQAHLFMDENHYSVLNLRFEINPRHPLIRRLSVLSHSNEDLATLVIEQLFKNSLVFAGLLDDPRVAVLNLNTILEISLAQMTQNI